MRDQRRQQPGGHRQSVPQLSQPLLPIFPRVLAVVLALLAAPGSGEVLFPEGSTWRYWDRGPLHPAALASGTWRDPGFDDSLWGSGQGLLAYGDATAATVLASRHGPNGASQQRTVYFRRQFDVEDKVAAAVAVGAARLWGRMLVDDGVVM